MDKQDELAACIRAAEFEWIHSDPMTRVGKAIAIAAAVRSFMGSDEVVGRVAAAICAHPAVARAAIRTALGDGAG